MMVADEIATAARTRPELWTYDNDGGYGYQSYVKFYNGTRYTGVSRTVCTAVNRNSVIITIYTGRCRRNAPGVEPRF